MNILRISAFVICIITLLGFGHPAFATALESAVSNYNGSATHLDDLWDSYTTHLDDAWEAYETMMCAWMTYQSSTTGDPNNLWSDFEDAYDDAVTAGDVADADFRVLLTQMGEAGDYLKTVMALDILDTGNAAYATGTAFSLPTTPFVFWNDPNFDPDSTWHAFDFPTLAVGSAGSHTSFTSSALNAEIGFWWDILHWLHFGDWANKHRTDGVDSNHSRAADYDLLCAYCHQGLAGQRTTLLARGYTDQQMSQFCTWFGGSCDDTDTEAGKAADLRRMLQNMDLNVPMDAAEDYIMGAWVGEFDWC